MSDFEFFGDAAVHPPIPHTPATHTVVLVDPTAGDGESALALIGPKTTYLSIVVLLSGPASGALREFADAESIDLTHAGWIYLDQVAERIGRRGMEVGTIVANGPDVAYEMAVIATEHDIDRVLLPASALRDDRHVLSRLARLTAVTAEVAEVADLAAAVA